MSLYPLSYLLCLSSGVFLLAFAILALRPRLSAARRLLIWQAAFAAVAACSPLAFLNFTLPLPILPAKSAAATPIALISSTPTPRDRGPVIAVGVEANAVPEVSPSASPPAPRLDWASVTWSVWALGVAAVVLRSGIGFLILRGVRRRSTFLGRADGGGFLSAEAKNGARVYSSEEIGTPMAAGFLSPVVLVPTVLVSGESGCLRAILLHEAGHAKRGDVFFLALAGILSAIHWFNPLVWLAAAKLRAESERAADDDALNGALSPTEYAEVLLSTVRQLKSTDRRLFPASRMSEGSEIGTRLSRILEEGVDRSSPRPSTRCLAIALAVFFVLAAVVARPVAAETPSSPSEGNPFLVRCVDEQGSPVAGAEVYLYEKLGDRLMYQGSFGLPEFAYGPLKTDPKGEAEFPLRSKNGEPFTARILARLPGKLVGGTYANGFPKTPPFEVKLHPSGKISGRVSVGGGGDLSKARVRLLRWMLMNTQRYEAFSAYPSIDHDFVPAFMETRPDAEGRFELGDLPANSSAAVAGFGPGFGLTQALSMPGHSAPIEITLEKEAVIEGKIADAETGAPAAGARITARPDASKNPGGDLIPYEAVADASGRFRIGSLREGAYSISLNWTGKWTMQQVDVDVRNGETKVVNLERAKGTIVSGVVSEDGSGKLISRAMVSAVSGDVGGEGLDSSTTKEDGRYTLVLPPGDSLLYISSVPRGFAQPKEQARRVVSIRDGNVTGGPVDFSLAIDDSKPAKAAKATGRVVDEKGRALANVLVSARFEPLSPSNGRGMQSGPVDSSAADGTFKIRLYPNGKYAVVVGGVSQSSTEKKFETGSGTEHALGDFVVRPANANAEGIVVDEKGDPVAGAEVTPSSVHKYAWRANQTTTDGSGKFKLPHLLPDESFSLYVSAPGFEPAYAKDLSPGATDIRVALKKRKQGTE